MQSWKLKKKNKLNLYYGKKSASQVPQSSWCSCVESSGISCELHSSLWWPSAAQMAPEKNYSPYSPDGLVRVKTAGMAHHPSSKMRRGEHVPSSPFPSNSTSNYAALQVTALFSPWLFSPYGKDPPEKGWPHHANFKQCSVSRSLSGCQLLSARAQALFCLPKKKLG